MSLFKKWQKTQAKRKNKSRFWARMFGGKSKNKSRFWARMFGAKSKNKSRFWARVFGVKSYSDEEISAMESLLGISFPGAYRDFMNWMGKDRSGPFRGTDIFLEDLPENRLGLDEYFAENEIQWTFEKPYVVFYCHQGYQYAWFEIDPGVEDPIVFYSGEERENVQPTREGTFSKFIATMRSGLAG